MRKKEFAAVEKAAREELGAAPTDMIQSHRNQLIEIDDLVISEKIRMEKYRCARVYMSLWSVV